MPELLAFATMLLAAVFLSGVANRSVLSTSILFLVGGVVLGSGFGPTVSNQAVSLVAELALFAVLFTDGMRASLPDLKQAWRLPGRALLFGLPLTLMGTALLAHFIAGENWLFALLIGAILCPTDPVLASAIVGREEVPARLRHLLNVESGVNDGIALPLVIVLMSVAGSGTSHFGLLAGEVGGGIGIGIVVPWLAIRAGELRLFSATAAYEPLYGFAIGLLLLGIATVTHLNQFLAAFIGGSTIATIGPEVRGNFHRFGNLVAELLKLGALMLFGTLISVQLLSEISIGGYGFAVLTLLFVRPVAMALALLRSRLSYRERLVVGWFGPKGFASVVFGLLVLSAGRSGGLDLAQAQMTFHLIAVVIAGSILAHSSTDTLMAHWLAQRPRSASGDPCAS